MSDENIPAFCTLVSMALEKVYFEKGGSTHRQEMVNFSELLVYLIELL